MKDTTMHEQSNASTLMMTRNHLTRSSSLQTSPQQQQQQQTQSIHHLQTKWSIKERLFLVSCVLINGESNWTFISDQLNKWMKYTSNYTNVPVNGNVTILGSNSINLPPINLRTNNQCSKQYKFIVKSYALKHGLNDLKKVYSHLAEERLKELKSLVISSHQQYKDVYNEIEQILEMNTDNFEQLSEIWRSLKSSESTFNRSNYGTRLSNEQQANANKTNDILNDDEAIKLNKNIEKINEINRKKKEELEAAAKRAAELEAAAQEEARLRAAEEAARNQSMLVDSNTNEVDQSMQVDTNQVEKTNEIIEIKQEQNISINENEKQSDEMKENDTKFDKNEDKSSSEEDIPRLHPKKKQKNSDNTETGIEWKPVIVNTEETSSETTHKANLLTDDESDTELQVKRPKTTFGSPRKPLKVIESSSSSSDTESKPDLIIEPTKSDSPKTKVVEEPVVPTPPQPTRKSNRTRNSLSINAAKEVTTVTSITKNEDSELIFTPLIKYDKKTDETTVSDSLTKLEDAYEIPSDKEEKESENGADTARSKRKSRAKKESETIDETNEEVASTTTVDNEEETEEQSTRASTLRSKRNLPNSSLNTSNNKRRSSNVSKLSKNLIVSVTNTKITTRGILSPKLSNNTPNNQEDQSNETDLTSNKDSGLLSIKCEPVQISNTSVINDIDTIKTEDANETSVTTRSSRSKDILNNAPFSSSSTSSVLSNNSSASLINKFEDEKAYRAWKKSILMVLNNIACHKHATVFMHPVKDDIAPGYSSVVYRPMDLGTLKKNIENGLIKSTKEFQRDIMLMFTNAIMYNSSGHDVHKISVEMYKEVLTDVEQLLNAQEAMGEDQKPLRFKDKRSSTASDRGTVIPGIELERNESNELNNEPVVNILMTTKKENFSKGDEALETASLNSSSSVSQTLTKTNRNMSSKEKFDSNLSCSTSVSTITSSSTTTNTKKRRPSSESSQAPKESAKEQPKSKKRRKSGR